MPLHLPINEKCNIKCQFCSAMGRDVVDPLVDDLLQQIETETEMVQVSGGEPLLSPHVWDIIAAVKNKGLFCELQSNGSILADQDIVTKVKQAGVDIVNINFPSHDQAKAEQITQVKGHHDRRIVGVNNLLKAQVPVRLTHIINTINFKDLSAFVDYVQVNFSQIELLQFSFVKLSGGAKIYTDIVPRYEQVSLPLQQALKKGREFGLKTMVDHIPMCYLGDYAYQHVDYAKIVGGKSMNYALIEKSQLPACEQCFLKKVCTGPRKDYVARYGLKDTVVKPYGPVAARKLQLSWQQHDS